MHAFITSLALFTLFLGAISAPLPGDPEVDLGNEAPPVDKVYIKRLTYAGSGCPKDTVHGGYTNFGMNTISLAFDQYVASVGPGIPITESRKNCNLKIDLVYPSGYKYYLYSTTYRGYLKLDPKVTAVQKSDYWFPTYDGTAVFYSEWTAGSSGYDKDYKFTDKITDKEAVWSPCGSQSTLNINTQIKVDNKYNKKGSGMITTDVIDHEVEKRVVHYYGVVWKRC